MQLEILGFSLYDTHSQCTTLSFLVDTRTVKKFRTASIVKYFIFQIPNEVSLTDVQNYLDQLYQNGIDICKGASGFIIELQLLFKIPIIIYTHNKSID